MPMSYIVCERQLLILKIFLGQNGSGMSRIDMSSPNHASLTQSDKAQAHENQPMKRSKDNSGIFKKLSNLPIENIETLS